MKTIKFSPITNNQFRMIEVTFVVMQFAIATTLSIFMMEKVVAFFVILYMLVCIIPGIIKDKDMQTIPWVSAIFLALVGSYAFHSVWSCFLSPIIVLGAVAGMMYGFAFIMAKIPTIPEISEFTINVE